MMRVVAGTDAGDAGSIGGEMTKSRSVRDERSASADEWLAQAVRWGGGNPGRRHTPSTSRLVVFLLEGGTVR